MRTNWQHIWEHVTREFQCDRNSIHGPSHWRRVKLFELSDQHFELLQYACQWHTHGQLNNDPTIGTCWDADRLDLPRVGMRPAPEFMSTQFGREIATHGVEK